MSKLVDAVARLVFCGLWVQASTYPVTQIILRKIYRNIDNAVKFLKVLKHLPHISDVAYCLGRA